MRFRKVWTVYRKEVLDLRRDRKTLLFMVVLPVVAQGALMYGGARVVMSLQRRQETKTLRVAASPAARRSYVEMIRGWLLSGALGEAWRRPEASGALHALATPRELEALTMAPNALQDPEAFEQWAVRLAGAALKVPEGGIPKWGITKGGIPEGSPQGAGAIPSSELVEFFHVVVQGLGFLEFVDPASLPAFPEPVALPESLWGVPGATLAAQAMRASRVDGYLRMPKRMEALADPHGPPLSLLVLHDSTRASSAELMRRVQAVVRAVNARVSAPRLRLREGADVAPPSQAVGFKVGGMLAFIIMLYGFLGCVYPAIDLGAGEKERQTLETVLLSPVGRAELAVGKFGVIMTTGLLVAGLSLGSTLVSLQWVIRSLGPLGEIFALRPNPAAMAYLVLLMVPVMATFAGVLLAISIYARSFKEAQNYMGPVNLVVMIPMLVGTASGLELNAPLALLPLVNVSLLAKEFLRGQWPWGYFGLAFVSSAVVAAVSLWFSVRQFNREEVLFRT